MSSAAATALQLGGAIDEIPIAIALFNGTSLRLIRSSSGFRDLLRRDLKSYEELFPPYGRDAATDDIRAVSSGRFDGLHGRRTLVDASGNEVTGDLWLRRISENDRDVIALVFLPADEEREQGLLQEMIVDGPSHVALLVTDHDWMLDFVSRDIETFLGENPDAAVQKPLLSLIHPATAAEFLLAVTRAIATRRGTQAHVRLRLRSVWQSVVCWVEPLCDHSPPRLGIVLTKLDRAPSSPGSSARLEQHLWRIAAEILAAGVLPTPDAERNFTPAADVTKLTSHQWEITMRLLNGERVPHIAKAMHVTQSTIRNHLAAVFRRFGVHSQGELIALLKRPPL